jgi:hypothetical protein
MDNNPLRNLTWTAQSSVRRNVLASPCQQEMSVDWESYKAILEDLWLHRNLNLKDVTLIMKSVFNFTATLVQNSSIRIEEAWTYSQSSKQFKGRFNKWKWRKFKSKCLGNRPYVPPQEAMKTHLLKAKRLSKVQSHAEASKAAQQYSGPIIYGTSNGQKRVLFTPSDMGFHEDNSPGRLRIVLHRLSKYLDGRPENDESWRRTTKFELIGRCQSMVTKCFGAEIFWSKRSDIGAERRFLKDAFIEMEKELGQIQSSIQMWDLLINTPHLLVLGDRLDLLKEYLQRLRDISVNSNNPLQYIAREILSLFLEGGVDSIRHYLDTASTMWAHKLIELRGKDDRSTLDALYVSSWISRRVTPETMEQICSSYEHLAQESRRENGEEHSKTLSIENAHLNTQWALASFMPDFPQRSVELIRKLHRKYSCRHMPTNWTADDRYIYFRTCYRLSDFCIYQGNTDLAWKYFRMCEAVPHDLRFRGYSMAVRDIFFKLQTLINDIEEHKRLKAEHWFQGLPDPSHVVDSKGLGVLLGGVLLQHRDASLFT